MVAPSSPFAFLESLADRVSEKLQPPAWAVQELQQRAVLLVNHVLQQEPEAQDRLARQRGRVVLVRWRALTMRVQATPAGLIDLAPEGAAPDLTLTVTERSPLALAGGSLRGDKPPVQIEGDVQLAAEINWLVDHVRWDVEDDLARLVGDAPAHAIGNGARKVVGALRQFIDKAARRPGPAGSTSAPDRASRPE